MTEETETTSGARSFPDTGAVSAAALFRSDDLTIIWHNDEYRSFMEPPYDEQGGVGLPYSVVAPLGYSMRYSAMREVRETGRPRSGVDRIFSVEDGLRLYHWQVHRPTPELLLTLIRCEVVRTEAGRGAQAATGDTTCGMEPG